VQPVVRHKLANRTSRNESLLSLDPVNGITCYGLFAFKRSIGRHLKLGDWIATHFNTSADIGRTDEYSGGNKHDGRHSFPSPHDYQASCSIG
jgi:hypothetical protein